MTRDLLLGIDVGTTGVKAILADAQGALLAGAGEEYPTAYPRPNWAEQDPDDWWHAAASVLARLLHGNAAVAERVAAVSVSSQAPTVVLVDAAGRPLHPALPWLDRRSAAQCERLHAGVGEEAIVATNGGRIDPYYLAPKLLWLRDEQPGVYRGAHRALVCNGYIVLKLTGAFTFDAAHGPLTLCFDAARNDWSGALLERMGLNPALLPPPSACGEIVGTVTPEAAQATGLPVGTPVLAGMVDATAAALEAGLVRPGDAGEMTGQSTVLIVSSDRPYLGRELIPCGHAVPGQWLVVGAQVASGGALRWVRDQLGEPERLRAAQEGADAFDLLAALAAESPPGANRLVFLPYLYGERSPIWDSDARGVFFGLSLATRKGDLVRAVMEGAAYGLRHNMEVAEAAGFRTQSLACVGGGARSALWNQIKADVIQRTVHLPRAATGAPMGNAILAAAAAGLHPNVTAAVAAMVAPGRAFAPDPSNAPRYDALYAVYRGLYPALKGLFAQLAEAP